MGGGGSNTEGEGGLLRLLAWRLCSAPPSFPIKSEVVTGRIDLDNPPPPPGGWLAQERSWRPSPVLNVSRYPPPQATNVGGGSRGKPATLGVGKQRAVGCTHPAPAAPPGEKLHLGVARVKCSAATPPQSLPLTPSPRRGRQDLQKFVLQPSAASRSEAVIRAQTPGLTPLKEGFPEVICARREGSSLPPLLSCLRVPGL